MLNTPNIGRRKIPRLPSILYILTMMLSSFCWESVSSATLFLRRQSTPLKLSIQWCLIMFVKEALDIKNTCMYLGALQALTSRWRPFGPRDFVLRALRALKPCDPRRYSKIPKKLPFLAFWPFSVIFGIFGDLWHFQWFLGFLMILGILGDFWHFR